MSSAPFHSGVADLAGVQHQIMTIDGGPLSVYSAGDQSAPSVALLHGAMYDEARFIWDQMFPALAEHFRIHAIDIPRHGSSRPWDGTLDHRRLMRILAAGFEHLELERFSLVGLSMGGGLSIEYAALHPDQIIKMALFEPGGLGKRLDQQFLTWLYLHTPGTRRMLSSRYSRADAEKIRKLLDKLYVGGSAPMDPDRLVKILRDEIQRKHDYKENDLDDWQTLAIGPTRLTWNVLDLIPKIECPTLWLRGADSVLVKQDEMENAVSLANRPGTPARLIVIPGAGHMLPLERPIEANAAVLQFLADE